MPILNIVGASQQDAGAQNKKYTAYTFFALHLPSLQV